MCGGLEQVITEQSAAPRTKERWNIQFLKLLLLPNPPPLSGIWGLNSLLPEIVLESVTHSQASFLPHSFQPNIPPSLRLCSSLSGSLSLSLGLSTQIPPLVSISLLCSLLCELHNVQ